MTLRRSTRLALRRQEDMLPHLPEQLVRECLLRVPYQSHSKLKAVCKEWRDIVNNPQFYEERRSSRTTQQLICMIQPSRVLLLDPLTCSWVTLPHIPDFPGMIPSFCKCVSVNGKLLLMGGDHRRTWEIMNTVYIFDFMSAKWRRGADMPTTRQRFACSVRSSTGRIYVAGGKDQRNASLASAELYNVENDVWETLPPMTRQLGDCDGYFVNDKLFVFNSDDDSAEVYDPNTGNTGLWTTVGDVWTVGQFSSLSPLVANGHLFTITDRQLMKYEAEKNEWALESTLPQNAPHKVSRTTEWRGHIFGTTTRIGGGSQLCYLVDLSSDKMTEFYVPLGFTHSVVTVEI